MDVLSVVGLLVGIIVIVGGNVMEGGYLFGLVNGFVVVIVLGGMLGVVML